MTNNVADYRQSIRIPYPDLERLCAALDGQALQAAVRLIDIQVRTHGEGLSVDANLTSAIGLHHTARERVRRQLEQVFDVSDGRWIHPEIAAAIAHAREVCDKRREAGRRRGKPAPDTRAADAAPGRSTAPAPAAAPARPPRPERPERPVLPASENPRTARAKEPALFTELQLPDDDQEYVQIGNSGKAVSLVRIAFDEGTKVLMASGRQVSAARSCIALLLKEYETGHVLQAVDGVLRQGDRVVEPFSYMRKFLSRYPKKVDTQARVESGTDSGKAAASPAARPRRIASPDTMGLSEEMVERIRARRSEPNYDFVDVDDAPASGASAA